jgi:hypothetical protein
MDMRIIIALMMSAAIVYVIWKKNRQNDITLLLAVSWCQAVINPVDDSERPKTVPRQGLKLVRKGFKILGAETALIEQDGYITRLGVYYQDKYIVLDIVTIK